MALTNFTREANESIASATPKFLALHLIRLDMALRKFRCGAREIYVEEVIRLIEVQEM